MKKVNRKKNKQKAPAYAFGIGDAAGIGNLLGTILGGATEEGSAGNIAGGAISGAASGAGIGLSVGGPIGAAVGGGLGLVGSLIGGIKQKKQLKEQQRRKKLIGEAEIGMNNAAEMNQEYWSENPLAYTFENGGILPDLAYVDNNEIIRDVNGNISKVPNTKPGTDNHLIDASGLESVLSDNIKDPVTGQTFAKAGKKIAKKYSASKGSDMFAENTNKLNKENVNKEYDKLLTRQEAVKQAKNIKNKSKEIPTYRDGMSKYDQMWQEIYRERAGNLVENVPVQQWDPAWSSALQIANDRSPQPKKMGSHFSGKKPIRGKRVPNNANFPPVDPGDYPSNIGTVPGFHYTYPTQPTEDEDITPIIPGTLPKFNPIAVQTNETPSNYTSTTATSSRSAKVPVTKSVQRQDPGLLLQAPAIPSLPVPDINRDINIQRYTPTADVIPPDDVSNGTGNPNVDWLSLAPVAYNFMQGLRTPEVESAVVNPYTPTVGSAMSRRRVNIEPVLAANRRSRSISNYNLSNTNSNTGINLAARTQAAAQEYASNADVYANRDNMNNQYLAEYANTMNNLGQQYVQNRVMTNDLNARNRAAARNYSSAAISQLGKWSQTQQLMNNAYDRDMMMLPFLSNMLKQGYTNDMVDQALATTKRRRK